MGTNLALALLDKGHSIVGIDRRPNEWTDRIVMIERDLATQKMPSLADLPADFGRPDIVVHLAANAKVHELVKHPYRAHENASSAFHVVDFCRQHQLPIIFSSSREVYGNVESLPVTEDHVNLYRVCSPYAAYKMADEMLIYSYANCYDLKYLIFRLSNVYGRYDNDLSRMTRVIHVFIDQMQRGEPITIYDRRKMIDFTHIDDCVTGFILGIEKLMAGEVVNETINLSSGSPATLEQLAYTIAEALGVVPQVIDEPIQPGEIGLYIADLTKARTLLGYEPRISFNEGIKQAIRWSLHWSTNHRHVTPPKSKRSRFCELPGYNEKTLL